MFAVSDKPDDRNHTNEPRPGSLFDNHFKNLLP